MGIVYAAGAALIGVFTGVVHSVLGEQRVFRPLFAQPPREGPLVTLQARRITRAVWHLPSLAWALAGISVLAARPSGGEMVVSAAAAVLFAASGIANLTALRQPHPGGLLLLAAAGLTAADWLTN